MKISITFGVDKTKAAATIIPSVKIADAVEVILFYTESFPQGMSIPKFHGVTERVQEAFAYAESLAPVRTKVVAIKASRLPDGSYIKTPLVGTLIPLPPVKPAP